MRLQDLSHVHTAGNAQRVEHDFYGSSVCQVRHVLFRQDARDHALVSVASGHLVTHAELALHGDVHLDQLDHARRQLVTLLQLGDLLVGDLAQNINLARGHLFDLVNLLVYPRVLVGILDALEVAGGDALDGFPVKHRPLGEQALVGALVMEVGLHLFAAQNAFQALETLIGKDSDLVRQVLLQALDLPGLNGFRALVLLLTLAGEDLYVHHRALDARRAGEGGVADVAGLLTEDGAQKFLFRRELSFTLGRYLAHHDVTLLYGSADADDAALIQIAQRRLAHIGNIASDFFRPQLGVAGLNLELLDVNGSVIVVFNHLLGNQDGVFKVVTAPGHEGHQHVASQRQLAMVCAGTVSDDLAFQHPVALLHDGLLVDAGVLVGALELGELINVATNFARKLSGMVLAFDANDDAFGIN